MFKKEKNKTKMGGTSKMGGALVISTTSCQQAGINYYMARKGWLDLDKSVYIII